MNQLNELVIFSGNTIDNSIVAKHIITMPDAFKEFLSSQPFWGLVIIILMALPILGAVAWVIMRALRKYDNNNIPR